MAGHSPEGHADEKVLHNAANCTIALTGMLPDSVAMNKGCNPQGSAAAPSAICRRNSRHSNARRNELQWCSGTGKECQLAAEAARTG
jgi:hypothetical protein